MNILKAYSSNIHRNIDFEGFINTQPNISITNRTDMSILLNDGTRILFRVVKDMEDVHKLAGLVFQHIDFSGTFDEEVKYYLMSRIR